MRKIAPEQLRELLSYDPESGVMTWLPRENDPAWTARFAGQPALTAINSSGYLHGTVLRTPVMGHRVVWALHYGEWPDGLIDHINGDPTDNRISNLRIVDSTANNRNMARSSLNTSGVPGVVWHNRDKKWTASIRPGGGARTYLGYFEEFEDAVAARKAAERELGFHENHGRERIVSAA